MFPEVALTEDACDLSSFDPESAGILLGGLPWLLTTIRQKAIVGTPHAYEWLANVRANIQAQCDDSRIEPSRRERYLALLNCFDDLWDACRPREISGEAWYTPDGSYPWAQMIAASHQERAFSFAWGSPSEAGSHDFLADIRGARPDCFKAPPSLPDGAPEDPYARAASFLSTTRKLAIVDGYLLKRLFDERTSSLYFKALMSLSKHLCETRSPKNPLSVIEIHHWYDPSIPSGDFEAWLRPSERASLDRFIRRIFPAPTFPNADLLIKVWTRKDGDEFEMHDRYILGDKLGLHIPDGADRVVSGGTLKPLSADEVTNYTGVLCENRGRMSLVESWEVTE